MLSDGVGRGSRGSRERWLSRDVVVGKVVVGEVVVGDVVLGRVVVLLTPNHTLNENP